MKRLYKKSELGFSLVWIVIYIVFMSLADGLSESISVEKSVTAPLSVIMSAFLIIWMKNNNLFKKYGICRACVPSSKMLFYLPLVIMISVNLWFGVKINYTPVESALHVLSMLAVGFLEEIIFRGLLFKAMCRDNLKSAIIVSGLTFGIGHVVNLFNGSGADLVSNLLQVLYASAAGILFAVMFYKTESLLPCIAAHSLLNALSVFVNEEAMTVKNEIISSSVLIIVPMVYLIYILKALPAKKITK